MERELDGDTLSADGILSNAMKKLEELHKGIAELDSILKNVEQLVKDTSFEEEGKQ